MRLPQIGSRVTLAIVPRERFSYAIASLQSVLGNTDPSVAVVYVDGRSPGDVSRFVREAARDRAGFRYLRFDRYLAPNEARNIALDTVDTEFVVFVDNDIVVEPGWLEALVTCADETGAALVGPLYLEGGSLDARIHMAGGIAHIEGRERDRHLKEGHFHSHASRAGVAGQLTRTPTELLEFHCLLVRTDVFHSLGRLDTRLLSVHEHVDLCLNVRAAGWSVYMEPASVVRYSFEGRLRPSDLPYIALRWSDDWTARTLEAFRQKWAISANDPSLGYAWQFGRTHRKILMKQFLPPRLRRTRLGAAVALFIEYMAWMIGRLRYRQPAVAGPAAMRPAAPLSVTVDPGPD